jgi:putative inorganic carbon (HCO3(-)) transporter
MIRHPSMATPRLPAQGIQALPRQVLLASIGAMLAAALLVLLLLIPTRDAAMVAGSLVVIVLFLVSGNHRLFCLWAVVILAPFTLAKNFAILPHMGGASSFSFDAIDPFLLMLLFFILGDRVHGQRHELRFSPLFLWWGAMILFGVLDVALGPLRMMAAEEVVRMMQCYLLFFVILNEVVRVRQFKQVAAGLAIGIALQSVIGVIQGVFKVDLGLQALGEATQETIRLTADATYVGGEGGFRINGLLGHPNLLAAYLSMLLPMLVALLFSRMPARVRVPLGMVVALGVLALLMTLSRTGWLSFGAAMTVLYGLYFIHPRLRRRFLFARLAAVVGLALLVLAFAGPIAKRFYESDPGALNFRYEWMDASWDMIQERPALGFGLNTFIYHLPGRTHYGGPQGLNDSLGVEWPAVHNVYLLTWVEQGTFAFACFIGMHLYLIWIGMRNVRRYYNDVLFAVNLGCLCGLLSLMIDGLSSIYLRSPAPSRMFWILAGMMVAVDYWNTANAPARVVTTSAVPRRGHGPLSSPVPYGT